MDINIICNKTVLQLKYINIYRFRLYRTRTNLFINYLRMFLTTLQQMPQSDANASGGSNSEHNAWPPSLSLSHSLSKAQMLQKYLIIHTYNDNAWVVVVAGCRRRSLQGLVGGATLYNNCCCRNTMGICRKIIAYLCGQQNVRGGRRVCQNFWGLLCDCCCASVYALIAHLNTYKSHTYRRRVAHTDA